MSHYTRLETKLVSQEHLVKALHDMGFAEVESHQTAQRLVGWTGDRRTTSAEVIVRKKFLTPTSNDIGFKKGPDGTFAVMISDYDRPAYGKHWLMRLTQRYAYHVALDALREKNFDLVEETSEENRTVRLTLRRMT